MTSNNNTERSRITKPIFAGLAIGFFLSLFVIIYATPLRELWYYFRPAHRLIFDQSKYDVRQTKKVFQQTLNRAAALERKFKRLTPASPYLIIDSSENYIYLKSGERLIHKGMCSTGSYTLLKTVDGSEKWIFKTPRGMFRIQGKTENPVWKMPDWAFIEEGLPVPAPDADERFEYGVLGDYALSLGQGYLIHGTLYQRFLGMPVTHGCVRLGDKELKVVYHSLNIGSRVFIY